MADFLVRAYLAGIGVAAVSGVLGCFIVWRRMAYFGDALSHAALLGVAVGLSIGIDISLGIFIGAIIFAILLFVLQRQREIATDTLLGILAHGALAMGLVSIALIDHDSFDLMALLVGDILAVGAGNLIWIYSSAAIVVGIVGLWWRRFLLITIHEDLAQVDGVPVGFTRAVLMCLIAATIAIAVKIVGVLLVTSLLIIPAATARRFSTSPEGMALLASLFGVTGVVAGLSTSLVLDTPSGPTIVVVTAVMFALSQAINKAEPSNSD